MSWFKGIKICFIVGTLGQGGAERQLFYMVSELQQYGANVHILCLTQGEFWEERIRTLGVPVSWVGKYSGRLLRLIQIIRKVYFLRPKILQSSHFYTNIYTGIVGKVFGIPNIGALRSDCFNEVATNGRWLGMLQLKFPQMIAGNSKQGLMNALTFGIPRKNVFLLPNVLDTELFTIKPNQNRNLITLLTVGNLTKAKRTDRFVRLMARMEQEFPGKTNGIIVGDGPLRSELQKQAWEAGLTSDQLNFLGSVVNVQEVYTKASIFILTSDWEGTPNVVMEAMACGLPVVATMVGGVTDLIRHGETGLLVNHDNEDHLFNAICTLINDSSLRETMGKKSREFIKKEHSLDKLPEYLLELYKRAVLT